MNGGSIRDIDDADIPFLQLADGGEDHGEFMLGGIGVTQADDILSAVIENDVVGIGISIWIAYTGIKIFIERILVKYKRKWKKFGI